MSGNWTVEFEAWLAKYNHVRYAITCHSGTHALEIIAGYYYEEACDRGVQHPTVLLPSLTYVATANAWLNAGWEVRFVDVDQSGIFSLRNNSLEFDDFDAICLVGLYGASITHIADVKLWREMMLHNKIITEDAAQHWLSAGGVRVGVAAAVSFDPTKNLGNFGNGGAVITDSSDIMHYARGWRDNGKSNEHNRLGTNSRMSELDCAHMLVKTRHIDQWQRRRAAIVSHWMGRLKGTGVRCLVTDSNYTDHCFHKFVIDCEYRDDLQKFLTSQGVETKVHYELPLHEQGIYRQWPNPGYLSNASVLSRRVLSLPIYPELTDLEVEYIIDSVVDYASTKHS